MTNKKNRIEELNEMMIRQEFTEKTFYLKMATIICSTILGFMTLVGVFFGKDGFGFVGVCLMMAFVYVIMMAPLTRGRSIQ